MKINFKRKQLVQTIAVKVCPNCNNNCGEEDRFCIKCGTELPASQKIKVYANYGKSGITSFSYVFPGGKTINSKGKMTFNIGNGISFTT